MRSGSDGLGRKEGGRGRGQITEIKLQSFSTMNLGAFVVHFHVVSHSPLEVDLFFVCCFFALQQFVDLVG